ncbi:MAG: dihydropyrimidine dehydrogenase, partial [Muribaculaceae bacterium]|nr:dihydropyrimidine dehydrogenase [Muribaculaceae bacterium]
MSSDRNEKWREELRAEMTAKERTAIPRAKMAELDPVWRVSCQREVNVGFSMDQAMLEATRCLDCP